MTYSGDNELSFANEQQKIVDEHIDATFEAVDDNRPFSWMPRDNPLNTIVALNDIMEQCGWH